MTTEIWRDFDPNLEVPLDLKNVRVTPTVQPGTVQDIVDNDVEIDVQTETLDDVESELDEDYADDVLDAPSDYTIISQTVRTAPDGHQVVDVIIDVEEIVGAIDYEVRITKA